MEIRKSQRLIVGDIIQVPIRRWNGEMESGKTTVIVTGIYPDFITTKTENGLTYTITNIDLVKYGIYPRSSVINNRYGA